MFRFWVLTCSRSPTSITTCFSSGFCVLGSGLDYSLFTTHHSPKKFLFLFNWKFYSEKYLGCFKLRLRLRRNSLIRRKNLQWHELPTAHRWLFTLYSEVKSPILQTAHCWLFTLTSHHSPKKFLFFFNWKFYSEKYLGCFKLRLWLWLQQATSPIGEL